MDIRDPDADQGAQTDVGIVHGGPADSGGQRTDAPGDDATEDSAGVAPDVATEAGGCADAPTRMSENAVTAANDRPGDRFVETLSRRSRFAVLPQLMAGHAAHRQFKSGDATASLEKAIRG
jgi:hypothetical protein